MSDFRDQDVTAEEAKEIDPPTDGGAWAQDVAGDTPGPHVEVTYDASVGEKIVNWFKGWRK